MQHRTYRISRRRLLEVLGAVGGAGAVHHGLTALGLAPVAPLHAAELPGIGSDLGKGQKVVVLGAGLAGLCAAYLLANNGFRVKVIEANPRHGGRSLTLRQGDTFQEVDGPKQTCQFTDKEQYLNAGPGRIPQHHHLLLAYCRHLKVALQPYIFLSEANRLQNDAVFDGKPVPFRQVRYSLRGEIAETLAKVTQQGALDQELSGVDRERFLAMLENFGALTRRIDGSFQYQVPKTPSEGYANLGYRVELEGAPEIGVPLARIDLQTILASDLWDTELFAHLNYFWQTSLMQPVGGMDMIWRAFLEQPVPADAAFGPAAPDRGPSLEGLVTLNSPVTSVRNVGDGVEVVHGDGVVDEADFCISTMSPIQFIRAGRGLSSNLVNACADIAYDPACKVGWQTRNRFWETDDGIYGGISWTKHIISQIWYPSAGYGGETGVLTAAYNRAAAAYTFGNLPLEKRFELALEGGEKLHPGNYRSNVLLETALGVAWQHMPYFSGGWPNDTFENRPESFRRLEEVNPEGRIYLAGDFFSYWPGWQEGAVAAANWAFGQIRERVRAN